MENFMERIGQLQSELKVPKNQENTFGKYKYRSCEDILEAVKPLLREYHLIMTISDNLIQVGARYYIQATATLRDTESDSYIQNTAFAREPENKKGMDDSQITGTASSYARKYALNGLFCIDDTKDADTDEYAKSAASEKQPQKKEEVLCTDCGKPVLGIIRNGKLQRTAEQVEAYAVDTYGVPLCWSCARERKKAADGQPN